MYGGGGGNMGGGGGGGGMSGGGPAPVGAGLSGCGGGGGGGSLNPAAALQQLIQLQSLVQVRITQYQLSGRWRRQFCAVVADHMHAHCTFLFSTVRVCSR